MPPHYLIKYLSIYCSGRGLLGFLLTILLVREIEGHHAVLFITFFFICFYGCLCIYQIDDDVWKLEVFTLMYPFIAIFSACGWNAFLIRSQTSKQTHHSGNIVHSLSLHPRYIPLSGIIHLNMFIIMNSNGGPSGAYGNMNGIMPFNSVHAREPIGSKTISGKSFIVAPNWSLPVTVEKK